MCTSVIKLCLKDARCACLFTGGLSISVQCFIQAFWQGGQNGACNKKGGQGAMCHAACEARPCS